ncbi:acetyltransferase, GNAT family-related protein [Trichomonas vaginalis G3]|uniref:Acetyltransferase, GNAT family-related protein n=1 Tax=Trichomonas vaginalis (strain ATCC PRA-98 / G3) TaxID=412133 RepID=A2FGA6_TRIV3|nr:N-acetyltransferase family [Trichomonas vaginalis G3]EAX96052.1 acetyltransferase, GNAT family-related protein [Trichomonas vaginalis G3]KAI5503996.1 N-acetyltransferase family [Trichomonas vaginalis G3]|eukprot:XP_001308982.1 acetyltransferase, GNAT family-related protein [Trichomonas vaginalis G3]
MIHATEKHKEIIMEYLYKQPEMNTILIGYVLKFGFDKPFQDVWIDNETKVNACFVRYFKILFMSSYDHIVVHDFVEEIINKFNIECYAGETSYLQLYDFKDLPKKTNMTLAHLTKKLNEPNLPLVKKLGAEHAEMMVDLMHRAFESNIDLDEVRNDLQSNSARAYGIFDGDKLISMAKSQAESEKLAMVVYVCSDKNYRGKGYASMCSDKISYELQSEGKTPCLYYVDPLAAKIYLKLGYENIGHYTTVRRQSRPN